MIPIIAITQRVEVQANSMERRDCLDQNWGSFFEQLGYAIIAVPNGLADPVAWFNATGCEGLVLSGGNDLSHLPDAINPSPERDNTERTLVQECQRRKVPVIGICRGFQMVNHIFGGSLSRCEDHVATRHAISMAPGVNQIWSHPPVNSYHNWGISPKDLAHTLSPLCYSDDGMVEAAQANGFPIWGLMWHPEREQKFDVSDIDLFHMMLGQK